MPNFIRRSLTAVVLKIKYKLEIEQNYCPSGKRFCMWRNAHLSHCMKPNSGILVINQYLHILKSFSWKSLSLFFITYRRLSFKWLQKWVFKPFILYQIDLLKHKYFLLLILRLKAFFKSSCNTWRRSNIAKKTK